MRAQGQQKNVCLIKLPSKEIIQLPGDCYALLGQVSNKEHHKKVLGKAGASRHLGRRPTVRGEAMNPVDHPHGGKSHGPGGMGKPPKTK